MHRATIAQLMCQSLTWTFRFELSPGRRAAATLVAVARFHLTQGCDMKLKRMHDSVESFYLGLLCGLIGMWWILYSWGVNYGN